MNCQEYEYNFTREINIVHDLTKEENNVQNVQYDDNDNNEISLKVSSSVLEHLNELNNIDTLSTTTESESYNDSEFYDSSYEYDDDPF